MQTFETIDGNEAAARVAYALNEVIAIYPITPATPHGIDRIRIIEEEMIAWMQEHEYKSVEQLKGSLSHKNCPDPSAFERAQYMRAVGVHKTP